MKPIASLSASLLAKKGTASPTAGLEPKGFISDVPKGPRDVGEHARPNEPATSVERAYSSDSSMEDHASTRRSASKRQVGAGKRIAMTLRLEHDQHLKLRLFSAHLKRSSQEVMMDALERYFRDEAPEALEQLPGSRQS